MPSRLRFEFPLWVNDARVGALIATLTLGGLTALLAPLLGEDEIVAVAMLFLLVVLLASALWGYVVGLFSAVLADVLLNVFFVPPLHKLTVQEPRNVVALLVFLAVAAVGASMLALLRRQLAAAEARRGELTVMLGLSRELASAPTPERALDALTRSIGRAVDARRCDILRFSGNAWQPIASSGSPAPLSRDDAALASLALESGEATRRVAPVSSRAAVMRVGQQPVSDTFLPFGSAGGESGVIHLVGPLTSPVAGDLSAVLRAFADEAAVALNRARLAEQARQAEAMQRSDEFKSVLLSSVSHDLRSPLTAIKAAVGSLRMADVEWSDGDRSQFLETIESQTDRLTAVVADLLEMSRLEGGAVRPTLEPLEVLPLLDDAVLGAAAAIDGRDVCVDAPSDTWVRSDYGLLLQALTNLIENAAKYSVAGGAIRLRGTTGAGRTILEVADEGPGISEADLPHIFEKFYRGSEGQKVNGTGLGLAIVRTMVELGGGRVTVDSSPAGTTFRISLPPAGPPK